MKSTDTGKLPTITTELDKLRASGLTIGVEVLGVQMTVNGDPVQYVWDTGSNTWLIRAQ